jgi:hypothetical protein
MVCFSIFVFRDNFASHLCIFPLPFRSFRQLYTCFKMENRFEIWTAYDPEQVQKHPFSPFLLLKDEKMKVFLNKTGTVHGRFADPSFDGTDQCPNL